MIVDDIEIMCGKQSQFFDKLLDLNERDIEMHEDDIISEFIDIIVANRWIKSF